MLVCSRESVGFRQSCAFSQVDVNEKLRPDVIEVSILLCTDSVSILCVVKED